MASNWKDVAELIGLAAIVASLIFVGLQMRQDQEIAIADTFASPAESSGTLATLIGEYANVWRRGLDGDELSPDDELRFRALVDAVETHFLNMAVRWIRLEINDPALVARDFAYAVYIHPGLRKVYEESTGYRSVRSAAVGDDSVGDPLRIRVNGVLAELDRSRPAIPEKKEYIFW